MKIKINNIEELKKLTYIFFKYWGKDLIIALEGELGVGKTEFIRQLMCYYEVFNVKSPSFNILNIYNNRFYHFDFYRLINSQNIEEKNEYLELINNNWTMIEWPNYILDNIIDLPLLKIKIKIIENKRVLEFSFFNYKNIELFNKLKEFNNV